MLGSMIMAKMNMDRANRQVEKDSRLELPQTETSGMPKA
jgi:hypothetical protein